MLDKCKSSCNLCGDLVKEKDRIKPTTKKLQFNKRPFNGQTRHPEDLINNEFFENFKNYSPTTTITTPRTTQKPVTRTQQTTSPTTSSTTTITETSFDNNNDRYDQSYEATNSVETSECEDKAGHCSQLAARGDCVSSRPTMEYYCPKSCKFC